MPLQLGSVAPSKLFVGATEVTKAFLGTTEVYSSSQPWTPAALGSALALWLDADDASTLTLNGSTVAQWNDKSGNGRHVAQATGSNQPTYNLTGFNSNPAVVFDGSNDNLFRNAQTLPDSGSIFLVLRYNNATTAQQGVIWSDTVPHTPRYYIQADAGTLRGYSEHRPGYFPAGSYTAGQQEILNFVGAAGSSQILRNGVLAGSLSGFVGNNNGLWIGNGNGFGSHAAMALPEIIAVSGTLSTANRELVEGYLAWKWALEANLPAGHPFRNQPPTV